MGNYFKALKETPSRFIDRVMTRSDDSAEIHDMKARSGNEMKKTLTWWDLMWFGVGAVIGSGIFVLTGQQVLLRQRAEQAAGRCYRLPFQEYRDHARRRRSGEADAGCGSAVGLGFQVPGSKFKVQSSGFRDQGSGIRDQGSRIKDQGSRIKDQGSRFRNTEYLVLSTWY